MCDMNTLSFSSELVRSSTGLVILTLLQRKPMYGYEILLSLGETGDGHFQLKQGTLYPLLYRLEREGLVKASWETPPSGKKRKVYAITPAGRSVRKKRVAEWARFTESVDSILKENEDV